MMEYILIIPTMLFGTHGMPFVGLWVYLRYVIVTETLKDALERPRPAYGITNKRVFRIRHLLTNYSFPSGDSAQAINYLSLCVFRDRPLYECILPLSALLGRVYYGVHFVGDVLAGSVIGWLCSYAVDRSLRESLLSVFVRCPIGFLCTEVCLALLYHALHKRISNKSSSKRD